MNWPTITTAIFIQLQVLIFAVQEHSKFENVDMMVVYVGGNVEQELSYEIS
jgi:hypothetical protein